MAVRWNFKDTGKGVNRLKRVCVGLLLVLFLSTSLFSGCTAARKPVPGPTKTTPSTPTPARKVVRTTPEQQIADRVTREAAKVSGVRKAIAVVSGKTAYIGLDLNVKGTRDKEVKKEVARRVKTAEPGLATVHVTSDPDLVTRLRNIADGIKKGKPVSGFSSELAEIGRRIKPEMSS